MEIERCSFQLAVHFFLSKLSLRNIGVIFKGHHDALDLTFGIAINNQDTSFLVSSRLMLDIIMTR